MNQSTAIKRNLVLITIVVAILCIAYWVGTHAYITISLANPAQKGEVTYIISAPNGKSQTVTTPSTSFKKLVGSGTYTVSVQQNDTSQVSVAHAGRFLTNSRISAATTQERSRRFVGNNPAPCMFYSSNMLFSYECVSAYNQIFQHIPASVATPTYTMSNITNKVSGYLEGLIHTSEGNIALMRAGTVDQGTVHQGIFQVSPDLKSATETATIDAPDSNKTYAIKPYRDGFLVYDNLFEQLFYYSSATAQPQKITIDRPTAKGMKPNLLSVRGDVILVAHTNNAEGDIVSEDRTDQSTGKVKNTFVIYQNGTSRMIPFDRVNYGDAQLCGDQRLCVLKDHNLEVYDISGKKPKSVLTFAGAESIRTATDTLLVFANKQVYAIDTANGTGYSTYSFGDDYQGCGTTDVPGGYILCVSSARGGKSALFVDLKNPNKDDIDKKIAGLYKLTEVEKISAYGTNIFISPNVGKPEFSIKTGTYEYNAETKQKANTKINDTIKQLGIDLDTFHIVNTRP